jgi:hypothetical protein
MERRELQRYSKRQYRIKQTGQAADEIADKNHKKYRHFVLANHSS